MSDIEIKGTDATGSKIETFEVPSEAPVGRLTIKLVEVLGLPVTGPDGLPISYKVQHIESGNQLQDEETLEESSVNKSDTLRLVPEMIAGA